MAKVDIANAAGCLRYYGGWADKITGQTIGSAVLISTVLPAAIAGPIFQAHIRMGKFQGMI
jgi:hypothetical protein